MSNQYNIDELFSKAANQPVVASFGETKELFFATVSTGSFTSKSKSSRILTLKNGLIMLAIVSTVVAGILMMSNNPKQDIGTINTVEIEKRTENSDSNEVVIKEKADLVKVKQMKSAEMLTSVIDLIAEVDSTVTEKVFFADDNLPDKMPILDSEYNGPAPIIIQDYQFPVLTEQEIAANHKRKKKMIKAMAKMDKKKYAYIPSGSFSFQGKPISVQAFYMQTAEVTNIEFKTFLFDLLINEKKDDFLKAKPDQAMWTKMLGNEMKALQNNYFSQEAYDEYPVVNISREAATMYCKWLTVETNKYFKSKKEPLMNDVRLPIRPEWEMAASGTGEKSPFPWGGPLAQNSKGCFLANYDPSKEGLTLDSANCEGCKTDSVYYMYSDGAMHTAKTKTYNPNTFGLYNMSGNVAEMVYEGVSNDRNLIMSTDNVGTAGGGWMSSFDSIKIDGNDEYAGRTTAHPAIGFRVVITHLGRVTR